MNGNRYSFFMFGLGAGAVVGLLCAPNPGARTRALIARREKELRDKVAGTLKHGKAAVQKTAKGVAGAFEDGRAALLG